MNWNNLFIQDQIQPESKSNHNLNNLNNLNKSSILRKQKIKR